MCTQEKPLGAEIKSYLQQYFILQRTALPALKTQIYTQDILCNSNKL